MGTKLRAIWRVIRSNYFVVISEDGINATMPKYGSNMGMMKEVLIQYATKENKTKEDTNGKI